MRRLLAGTIGLLVAVGGGYLVILWWDGNVAQRFISGALAAGGLSVVWSAIKGEGFEKKSAEPTDKNKKG